MRARPAVTLERAEATGAHLRSSGQEPVLLELLAFDLPWAHYSQEPVPELLFLVYRHSPCKRWYC